MFGISGLGCTCSAVVWSYMLLNPFDYFICSFYFVYILCLQGIILFLASVIWTYMLVTPFDCFIFFFCLFFCIRSLQGNAFLASLICSILFGFWKGTCEKVQLASNRLLCSVCYSVFWTSSWIRSLRVSYLKYRSSESNNVILSS
jgi:hypothetical protein